MMSQRKQLTPRCFQIQNIDDPTRTIIKDEVGAPVRDIVRIEIDMDHEHATAYILRKSGHIVVCTTLRKPVVAMRLLGSRFIDGTIFAEIDRGALTRKEFSRARETAGRAPTLVPRLKRDVVANRKGQSK